MECTKLSVSLQTQAIRKWKTKGTDLEVRKQMWGAPDPVSFPGILKRGQPHCLRRPRPNPVCKVSSPWLRVLLFGDPASVPTIKPAGLEVSVH